MSSDKYESLEVITKIRIICGEIVQSQDDNKLIMELQYLLSGCSPTIVRTMSPTIFSAFYPILKNIATQSSRFKITDKQKIVDTFRAFFEKTTIDKLPIFLNIYGFLLFEIYDPKSHEVLSIDEEYKLSVVKCMTSLVNCLDNSVVLTLYTKENAPKLCQMLYALLGIAKNDNYRELRISSITCIMAIARVYNDEDFNDYVMRDQIAEMFMFFLPGVASQLKSIALIDEKFGHKIPTIAIHAWGRIVALLMQNYKAADHKLDLRTSLPVTFQPSKKFTNDDELKDYLEKTQRTPEWYLETDKKLQQIITEFRTLTYHSHCNVRLELAKMCSLLINNCMETLPISTCKLVQITIALSEDADEHISKLCLSILKKLSKDFHSDEFKLVLENLEEDFFNTISSIPRTFNGIDENEQIVSLNLIIGYINIFGKHNLTTILHSPVHLNRLLLTLIHISEFDKSGISLLEEYAIQDLETEVTDSAPWKKFRYFRENSLRTKIETICSLLGKFGATKIISDFLLDTLTADTLHIKEAIFLLNELVAGIELSENLRTIKTLINTYTEECYWYLPLSVQVDEQEEELSLGEVQSNIIQVCLLVEGIGKIASSTKSDFQQFLLKTLYMVLERAGSGHPLLRAAGLSALSKIAKACSYDNITTLINSNIDYFSFHVERKLSKPSKAEGALNVLEVVMRYSTIEVLESTSDVVKELLSQVDDHRKSKNLTAYLRIFKMFLKCLHRWLNIQLVVEPFKSKAQKQAELEDFKVSNIEECNDYSDEIMGKSAEELYNEDMEKSRNEIEKELEEPHSEGYQKPIPTIDIKLTVSLLTKSLHFLPSKDPIRKILVLEILKDGICILKDWEDELLPIVHQIWSPLVDRFKETKQPLIINYSFQLLATLGHLSRDFIRSRTAKEVLPNILTLLDTLSEESHLKDRGSAYRYTQNYKLQITILPQLARLIIDLDLLQEHINRAMDVVFKYLSNKQPKPLQIASIEFFKTLITYDPEPTHKKIKSLIDTNCDNDYETNIKELLKPLQL